MSVEINTLFKCPNKNLAKNRIQKSRRKALGELCT